jgi:serine/threonine-protein kinase
MKKLFIILLKIIFVLVVLAGLGYYAINAIMSSFVREKGEVLVPDLQGKTLIDSLEALSQAKLAMIKEDAEYNQDVPSGVVIRQFPPAGTNVKEGKTIRITVSMGGEIVYVPNLTGETIRSATILLRASGLVLGELTKKASVKYEEGVVLQQDPVAGSTVEKETTVNVIVSNGAPTNGDVLMFDWIGKSGEEAKQWAMDNGYEVSVIEQQTKLADPGFVFNQVPMPDEKLTANAKITFYIGDSKSIFEQKEEVVTYTLPETGDSKRVRLVLVDDRGEKDIFNGVRKPGSVISVPVKVQGKASVKVFINNVSIETMELENK